MHAPEPFSKKRESLANLTTSLARKAQQRLPRSVEQVRKRKRAPVTAVEGYELKTFHGHLTEDYNHPAHVVVYKEQLETRVNNYCKPPEVSPWVSTDRTAADEHMMNLATLETDIDISSRNDG